MLRTACGVALLLSALLVADAQAQDDGHRQLLEDAVSEYNAGRFAEARALFLRAHEAQPSARTLRGIGMAAFELREYVEALRSLNAALASTERPLTDGQRTQVESLIRRATAYVGRFQVRLEPEDAELRVDGAPATLEPNGTLVLDLGEHEVTASCPGCATQSRSVHVRGGEEASLAFRLEPAQADALRTETEATDAPLPPPEQPGAPLTDGGGGPGAASVVLLAGGALFAGGAVASAFWWADRNGEIDLCDQAGDRCRNGDSLETERNLAVATTLLAAGTAVAFFSVGAVVWVTEEEGATPVACAPTMGGVSCVGQF